MKRQLIPLALSVWVAAPLMAQDSNYPAYGYGYEPSYDSDTNTRQFNFNPGNVMDRMGNPMRNMFGSSNRGYDDYYPGTGYAPPAYPPAYGYPVYPGYTGYPQPYPENGYAPQVPGESDYARPYGQPETRPARVEPRAEPPRQLQAPAYEETPPAARAYQPRFTNSDRKHFRFRPLEQGNDATDASPPEPAQSPDRIGTAPQPPVYRDPEPLAPLTYPRDSSPPEPLAPLTYPQAQNALPAPEVQVRDAQIEQDPSLKFRPLDKPGYSSDLQE